MRKNRFIVLALLLVLALSAALVNAQATEIQLMGWSSSESENVRLQELVDTFNEQNTDINVTLNQVPDYDSALQTAIAGGTPPDVFYVDSFRFPDLYLDGVLASGEGIIENPDDFYPGLRAAFSADGEFICPPKDFSTLALQINNDMFTEAGVEPPTTWEELEAAAMALTNDEHVGLVVSNDLARWAAFLYQAGGGVANEDFSAMTLDTPEALEAMEFYTGLATSGYAKTSSALEAGWPGEAFGQGKAAMATEGNWIYPYLKDNFPDVNFSVVPLPEGPGGAATMAFTVCYGVAAGGQNQEAAWQLVNFLTGEDGMKQWTDLGLAMPTRASLREGWLEQFPDLEAFLAGADYARGWQFTRGFGDVMNTINDGLLEVFDGSSDAADVLEEAQEVGTEILEEAASG